MHSIARTGLVFDGVQADRGLAGLTVADDEFSLATADRYHRVDGLDASLQRHPDGRPLQDAGRRAFDRAVCIGRNRPLAVNRAAECIHDTAEQRLAGRDFHNTAGAPDRVALPDLLIRAEQHGAHEVLLQVLCHAVHAAAVQKLPSHAVRQPIDMADAVSDRHNGPDVLHAELRLIVRNLLFEDRADLIWT